MAIIRHNVRELNENGTQSCRRCGEVVTDLEFQGHHALPAGAIFEIIGVGYCTPKRISRN